MQLDVDMSPPASDITFRPGLTHLTFDLDTWPCILPVRRSNETSSIIFNLVALRRLKLRTIAKYIQWIFMTTSGPVTDRQKVTQKNPLCNTYRWAQIAEHVHYRTLSP